MSPDYIHDRDGDPNIPFKKHERKKINPDDYKHLDDQPPPDEQKIIDLLTKDNLVDRIANHTVNKRIPKSVFGQNKALLDNEEPLTPTDERIVLAYLEHPQGIRAKQEDIAKIVGVHVQTVKMTIRKREASKLVRELILERLGNKAVGVADLILDAAHDDKTREEKGIGFKIIWDAAKDAMNRGGYAGNKKRFAPEWNF